MLRQQASSTGLTAPQAKAKAAANRGPTVPDLVANALFAEEPPEEMLTASSGTTSDWRGLTSGLVTKNCHLNKSR